MEKKNSANRVCKDKRVGKKKNLDAQAQESQEEGVKSAQSSQ